MQNNYENQIKKYEAEVDKDLENEQEIDISQEEFSDLINQMNENKITPLLIGIENLEGIEYNKDEFENGLNSMSYVVGQITALFNAGINNEKLIMDYIINKEGLLYQDRTNQLNAKTNLEVSRIQAIKIESEQL
jgi:hypothetical protein